jgi:DNA-binding MarR family transcriptional regulator
MSFTLRELPKYECLRELASRIPEVDPSAVEACLVTLRTASDVLDSFDVHFARHGLSQGRFTVLMLLTVHPDHGQCPSELADRAGVTRATMTGLLDGLERDGFLVREPHPEDRRTITARLTERGHLFLREMLPDHFRRIAALMADLPEDERQTLVRLLSKVRSGITALVNP